MPREHYFGFYPTPPVWIGEKPTPEALGKMRSGKLLYDFMSVVEASEERGDLKIDVTRDGLFALSSKPLAEKVLGWRAAAKPPTEEDQVAVWSDALEYLNCLNLLFQSAFVRVLKADRVHLSEVTVYNAFTFELEPDAKDATKKKFAKGGGWALGYSAHVFSSRFAAKYASGQLIALDERIAMRVPATVETVKACFADFFQVVEKDLLRETAMVSRALAQYKVANYSGALVLLWFLIEEFIDGEWKAFLAKADAEHAAGVTPAKGAAKADKPEKGDKDKGDKDKRMWSDRRKYLGGRDFSASIVANILELVSALDLKLFRMIDRVRGYRNAIVHNREDFDARALHCQEAFQIAKLIIEKRGGPSLEFSMSWTVPSL